MASAETKLNYYLCKRELRRWLAELEKFSVAASGLWGLDGQEAEQGSVIILRARIKTRLETIRSFAGIQAKERDDDHQRCRDRYRLIAARAADWSNNIREEIKSPVAGSSISKELDRGFTSWIPGAS